MKNKDRIRSLIRDWVRENYGESEANDPSWSIVKLANYLANHFQELKEEG